MLLGYGGLNLPYDVPANQYMNLGGQKFSKSMGVSIDIPDMLTKFKPDIIRYYLSANMPEMKDSEFSWEDFAPEDQQRARRRLRQLRPQDPVVHVQELRRHTAVRA